MSENCHLASCADEMFFVCRAFPVTKLRSILELNTLIAALSIIMADTSEGEASTSGSVLTGASGPADPRARKRRSESTSLGETDSSKKHCADNGSGSSSSGDSETDSSSRNYPDYGELASVCTQHKRGRGIFLWILWFAA